MFLNLLAISDEAAAGLLSFEISTFSTGTKVVGVVLAVGSHLVVCFSLPNPSS
jgi:hypothetical protein